MKAVVRSLLLSLCLWVSLSGCHTVVQRLAYVQGDHRCEVEVFEEGAAGNCVTKGRPPVSFALWSTHLTNYSIMFQGLNSNDPDSTPIYGLVVNGVEQEPSDDLWKRLLNDPRMLCGRACGPADPLLVK